MAAFGRVEVTSIKATEPRANFAEDQLDHLADLILKGEGVVRPVLVKQIDYETYQLIDGALAYYAAVRAYEKDRRRGEMVNAFIIKPNEDETLAKQQLAALEVNGNPPVDTTKVDVRHAGRPSEWITSFETRLSDTRSEISTKTQDLDRRLKQLEITINQKPSDLLTLINELETDDLLVRLSFYGADKAKAKAIVEARQGKDKQKFESYEDLLNSTKGLAAKGLIGLLDHFRIHSQ